MRASGVALALLAGCAGAPRPPPDAPAPRRPTARAPAARAGWTRVAPRQRHARIDDLAALADGGVAILSGSDVFRVGAGGGVTPACALDPELALGGLHASGARWWALAGEAFAPVVFRGEEGAAGCVRVALPPLVARDAPPGRLRSTQAGGDAIVWSSAGPMARSRDGAHTWQRIPPLPEAEAVTVSGTVLYAAALLGGAGSRAPFDRHGYEVFALPEGETRWAPLPAPGDRAAPVVLLPREGGGVAGVDVLGGFELTPQGGGLVGRSSGPHFARDRPRLLAHAARDAAIGLTDGLLVEHRPTGWRPLPSLPGGRLATAFDAAPDGALIVSDGHDLWRVRAGAAPAALLRSPLEGGRPTRLAAAGPVIAALSVGDRLSVSRDGGASWATTRLPREAGTARSLAVLPDGSVAVITGGADLAAGGAPVRALWVGHAELHRVDLPRGARVFEGAALHAVGDRWILAAGDVFVSDDQGARWRRTLSPPAGHADGWGVVAVASAGGRTAYALDSAGALWRSDDTGDQFVALTPGLPEDAPPRRPPAAYAAPEVVSNWLRWDGGDALLASVGRRVYRFDRDGHGGPLGALRGAVFGAAVEGGAVIATSAAAARVSECGHGAGALLLAISGAAGPWPVPEVCAHRAVAFALDGDALYTADADGTIERASLRGLWREAIELGAH